MLFGAPGSLLRMWHGAAWTMRRPGTARPPRALAVARQHAQALRTTRERGHTCPTKLHPGPVYGPVHSRRLGVSLGVNLMPTTGKICTFDCLYCEDGFNAERVPWASLVVLGSDGARPVRPVPKATRQAGRLGSGGTCIQNANRKGAATATGRRPSFMP